MKKNLLIAAAVTALSIGAIGPVVASADTSNPSSSIADKIATKFNLNKDEVKKVFAEEREARHEKNEQAFKDKLAESVKSGKITQAQSDKIQQKHAEMEAEREKNRDAFKDMTREERREAMQKKHAEMEKWAEDNGIDESIMRPNHGGNGPKRHGME